MKAKNNIMIDGKQMNEIAESTMKTYNKWLQSNHMTEADVLKIRTYRGFKIEKETYNDCFAYSIHYGSNMSLGEQPLVIMKSNNKLDNAEAFFDLSFLLLHIAKVLDEANSAPSVPAFERRDKYFTNIVVDFLSNEKKLFII